MSASPVDGLDVAVYTVPTGEPESDGTLTWTETTVVVVEARAGRETGLGFTYATAACATLIRDVLAEVVLGGDPFDVPGAWAGMVGAIRNLGRPGIASMAIAAVDTALWDLKARLLQQPLARLLGIAHDQVAVYGSGGFTSFTDDELVEQLSGWAQRDRIPRVKLKVGTAWGARQSRDLERVRRVREALGGEVELYVDANGAYDRKQAIRLHASSPTSASPGSRSRSPRTTWRGCARSATRAPPRWRPASTATTSPTSSGCSRRARSTASRPTFPAAPGSPSGCA
jgi:L-alanine-DL-glutamate epimerase-like enolase superfamily enzyme